MSASIPENALSVSEQDVNFLKALQKTLTGHKVRLLWYPASNRQKTTNPTHVVIVSDEQVFSDYIVFELEKFRKASSQAIKQLRGI
jgi:hypothetical protein